MKVPIIDVFAGSGGLGEGFSKFGYEGNSGFEIALSIENESNAHKTLELRSFFRKFTSNQVPKEYYSIMQEKDLKKRDQLRQSLFEKYPQQAQKAKFEAWRITLGQTPIEEVDQRVREALAGKENWVLIGGPPCQAYSLAARGRLNPKKIEADERLHLYKEFVRIVAVHSPSVFLMENVKGLMSSKLNGERIFPKILSYLESPKLLFNVGHYSYKLYSLCQKQENTNDIHSKYLIKSEDFGIPQKRHRVFVLGIREDIKIKPCNLEPSETTVSVSDVIADLPMIRASINRSLVADKNNFDPKRRQYKKEEDSFQNWFKIMSAHYKDISHYLHMGNPNKFTPPH
ncbi:MAG: DNA cytosine methyltransferase [Flavobacteriaceae bacterium]|nr:DNA cytosine methyltransferase [Flavobacteriaceae bacterium]